VFVYNPGHYVGKRKAEVHPAAAVAVVSAPGRNVVRAVNPSHFNFTKIKANEVLLRLATRPCVSGRGVQVEPLDSDVAADADADVHVVAVNASPLLPFTVLFIPTPERLLPQVITPELVTLTNAFARACSRCPSSSSLPPHRRRHRHDRATSMCVHRCVSCPCHRTQSA
jgi:hypothetical protein